MSLSILLSKAFLVPVGATAFVGTSVGGAYYIYTNKKGDSSQTNTNATKPFSTGVLLGKVKTTGAESITANKPLTCTIEGGAAIECEVYKFTAPKTINAIEKFEKTTLTKVATPSTDLLANNYVVIELKNSTVTFESIKNKTITLKSDTKTLTTIEFDQLLSKKTEGTGTSAKEVYEPIAAVTETYIVSSPTTITTNSGTNTAVGFRCTYTLATKLVNVDDSCKLINIPGPASGKKITTLNEVKEATTVATDLTASTFYKLTIDKNKLYNLDFANATGNLKVEVSISQGNKSADLTVHQQWIDNKFIGKTDLLLAKFIGTDSQATIKDGTIKCAFDENTADNATGHFECKLHTTTPGSGDNFDAFTIDATAVAASTTFTKDNHYTFKLTESKSISVLPINKEIFIHGTKADNTKVAYKFQIKALLSGDITTTPKTFLIS